MEARPQDWRRLALALVLALGCHGLLVLRLPPPFTATVPAPPPTTRIALQLSSATTATPRPATPTPTPTVAAAPPRVPPAPSAEAKAAGEVPRPGATSASPPQDATPLGLDDFLAAARRYSEDSERPRRLGPGSVLTATEAAYLRGWRERIERLGTLNFPPAARAAAVGEVKLRLRALLARDGRLEALSVVIGSGYPAVDAAALAIVRQAHPYLPFPPAFGAQDRLEVVRDFTFRTR